MKPDTFAGGGITWRTGLRCACALMLGLGFAVGSSAQDVYGFNAKSIYYKGKAYSFSRRTIRSFGAMTCTENTYDGTTLQSSLLAGWTDYFSPFWSSVGLCAFDDKLYCFYTDGLDSLRCGTVVPGGDHDREPRVIADVSGTGHVYSGAAAAVLGESIYVFTVSATFRSADGNSFTALSGVAPPGAFAMLDAVMFYPVEPGAPASVMVLYSGANSELKAAVFDGTTFSAPVSLPKPTDWFVFQGNLLLGSSGGNVPSPGRLSAEPTVQFYGIDRRHLGRWEYGIGSGTWSFNEWTPPDIGLIALQAIPYYQIVDSIKGTKRLLHILSLRDMWNESFLRVNPSDFLVPQINDSVYGWAGSPTPTNTATGDDERSRDLRSTWTLLGVVLGPPPFAMNGVSDAGDPKALSEVQYGAGQGKSVAHESTFARNWSVSAGATLKGGLGKISFDGSYSQGLTTGKGDSDTVTVSTYYKFGPGSEAKGDQGIHGWAIFNAPTLVTQRYKIYAYDYDMASDHGTYANQDLYATNVGTVVQQEVYFTLRTPSEGTFSGLFQGMNVFPDSTDLEGWHTVTDWNNGGPDWEVIFGDKSNPQMGTLNLGANVTQRYTNESKTLESKANTSGFKLKAGCTISDWFTGFSTTTTATAGMEWQTKTNNETTVTRDISCTLDMPIPPANSPPNYVKTLSVQPYWLQAKTNKAPWVPPNYSGSLPWCIAWKVLNYKTFGGGTCGMAAPPESASGTLRGGGEQERDTFKLTGGRLAWLDEEGTETPVPMTAGEFDPSRGASVTVHGQAFEADGTTGRWVRTGDIWKYRTREGTKRDPFALELDFAGGTWSFDSSSKDLDDEIGAAGGAVFVRLDLQEKYAFTQWIDHHVDAEWSAEEKKATWEPAGVHEIQGAYDSRKGVGHMVLKGHLPKDETRFGDTEIVINGVPVAIPLLGTDNFLDKLARGGVVRYEEDGLLFEIDLGAGRWKARIEGERFQEDMRPRAGALSVQVRVGGEIRSDQTFEIQNHTTRLAYRR